MNKILTVADMYNNFSTEILAAASENLASLQCDIPFWALREECRMLDGSYIPSGIAGDEHMRFLHMALDGTGRVAYTKNSEKGADDIQTVTTLEAYREKFGLTDVRESSDSLSEFILRTKTEEYFYHLRQMNTLEAEIRQLLN